MKSVGKRCPIVLHGSTNLIRRKTSRTSRLRPIIYNVDEAFLQAPTAAWGNLWDCRAALRKLVSSVYREIDLNIPFGKNGKFLFQLGYTPVVSDMKKIVQKTAALSFPKWALAVWDMDTATLYMVKYDRSH